MKRPYVLLAFVVGIRVVLPVSSTAQWEKVPLPPYATYVSSIIASGPNLFTGTWGRDSGCVFISTNSGTSWTATNSCCPPGWVDDLATDGPYLLAGTYGQGVFRSTNNGATWAAVNSGLRDSPTSNIGSLFVSGSNIFVVEGGDYAGTHGPAVFRSTNNGAHWAGVNSGLPDTTYYNNIAFALDGGNTNLFYSIEAQVIGPTLFRSIDNGTSWSPVLHFLDFQAIIRSLAVSGSNVFAGGLAFGGTVLLSTDNGTSWTVIATNLTSGVYAIQVVNGSNVFVGTESGGDGGRVYLLTNDGASWTTVNTGLRTNYVGALAISDGYLFAGAYGVGGPSGDIGAGVWRRPISEMITSVETPTNGLPHAFLLGQNYPNPFNPSTRIMYQIPHSGQVILKVYDELGREVRTLINDERRAGSYETTFDATGLASGVYFYRLQAGVFVATRKLLLLK